MEERGARVGVTGAPLPQEFKASRWTRGNRVFPTRISVSSDRVLRTKPRLMGSTEESIAIAKVASVKLANGMFFSDVCIESTGGTDPITGVEVDGVQVGLARVGQEAGVLGRLDRGEAQGGGRRQRQSNLRERTP